MDVLIKSVIAGQVPDIPNLLFVITLSQPDVNLYFFHPCHPFDELRVGKKDSIFFAN